MSSINSAIAAYSNTARAATPQPEPMAPTASPFSAGPASFGELVQQGAETAYNTGLAAETMSRQAVNGKAELAEVVTAVANAEVTLQTVVSIRDRVVSAYQDIMRMPI
ncbi:MAG: flagellar hook-basal body complex protein FliE [Alphaproteobacteria bacterium]|nr:flagellar hook-basal body complex protein FliE [Alphaproteobacteria bacterium]TAD88849.1 MAG: flagellar hook-basal body complex protein FliE [Alphaproteobacteria bacterium]